MMDPKELLPTKQKFIPEIVDETGKKINRPDVLQMVIQLAQLAQLAKIRKSLEGGKPVYAALLPHPPGDGPPVPSIFPKWPWRR